MKQALLLVVVGLLSWGIAWVTRCRPVTPQIRNPSRSGKRALLATGIAFVATIALSPLLLPASNRYGSLEEMGFAGIGFIVLLGIPALAVWLITPAEFNVILNPEIVLSTVKLPVVLLVKTTGPVDEMGPVLVNALLWVINTLRLTPSNAV